MKDDENKENKVLGDNTNIGINLRWLIQIVVVRLKIGLRAGITVVYLGIGIGHV